MLFTDPLKMSYDLSTYLCGSRPVKMAPKTVGGKIGSLFFGQNNKSFSFFVEFKCAGGRTIPNSYFALMILVIVL